MKERGAKDSLPETESAQISRREGLKLTAASAVASLLPAHALAAAQTESPHQEGNSMTDNNAIHPFDVSFSEAELTELRRRINATKWPESELVLDASQGVQLATM